MFENGKPEEFFLFVRNFNITLVTSGTLEAGTRVQYISTIVCGESLFQFDLLSDDVESTKPLAVEYIIKGLEFYLFPVNYLSKKSAKSAVEL